MTEFLYIGQGPLGTDKKLTGYKNAFYGNGILFDDEHFIHHPTEQNNSLEMATVIEEHIRNGCIKSGQTGVLCGNDVIALQFITAALRHGYHINEDYLLVGFDDTMLSKSYGFSSIRQPIKENVQTSYQTSDGRHQQEMDRHTYNQTRSSSNQTKRIRYIRHPIQDCLRCLR